MWAAFWLLAIAALTVALDVGDTEEPWVEEEELEEPYTNEREDHAHSRKAYVDEPYEEQVRIRRRCCDYEYDPAPPRRTRRSPEPDEYNRKPRQVHQYEVHEFIDEGSSFPSPPYEEMLAASAEHYHRVYAAQDAPASAHYHSPEVSAEIPIPLGIRSGSNIAQFAAVGAGSATQPVAIIRPPQKQGRALPLREAYVAVNTANPASVFVKANKFVPLSSPVQFVAPINAATIPIALSGPDAPVVGPAPIPSTPAPAAPPQRLAGDQSSAAAGHHHQHHHHVGHSHNVRGENHHHGGHGHTAGGGHQHHGAHHGAHGGKSSKGHKTNHWVDKGGKGHKEDERHRKEYEEATGKKHKNHDHAGHKGGHEEEAHGSRGAQFDEKKGHKKGHKTKGYHNKYHKDEFHKEHKFYDDFHKSGEHHRFGKFHAKHSSNDSGKKKAHHLNAGHDVVEKGKKGYSHKGHVDADHKGYKGGHGHEEHNEKHSDYGKKGGKEGGKSWGYSKQ